MGAAPRLNSLSSTCKLQYPIWPQVCVLTAPCPIKLHACGLGRQWRMAQVHGVLHLPGRLGFTKEIWSKCVAYSGFKVSNVWPYKVERPVLSGKEWFDHFGCRKNKLWKSLVELLLYPSLAWLSDQDGHLDLFFSIDIYQCIFCKENMLGSKCSLHMCLFLCGLHRVDTYWTESRATSYWFRVLIIVGTLKAYPWENKWWKRLKLGKKNLERNNRRGDESIRGGEA